MLAELIKYMDIWVNHSPSYIYMIFLLVFCCGSLILLISKEKNAGRGIAILLLIEYAILIYCSTVVFRVVRGVRKFDYMPFWSYEYPELFVENVLNTLLFIPIGLLLGLSSSNIRWWQVLLIGGCMSVSVELIQLMTTRGFSEVDDVIHNSLGCMIGYGVYKLVEFGYEKHHKSHLSNQ